jgi:Tol biopolymer transport system component
MSSLLPRPDECTGLPVVQQRTARRPQTIALLPLLVATTLCAVAPDLPAQRSQAAEVPTIEPHFTRVYEVAGATHIRFPSLSPDGRWIAFSAWGDDDEVSLWLVPADGGEAIRLTHGHYDDQPVWFPSGDRIAFRSDRPARGGNGGSYVMSLPVDPETGQPTGPPRQVSVDNVFAWLDVSPDGEWIAFSGWAREIAILVVPSAGGASRIVAEAYIGRPVWSPDGKSIYYVLDQPHGDGDALIRASVDGTKIETVFTWPEHIRILRYPEGSFVLRATSGAWRVDDRPSTWELTDLKGRALARLELPPRTTPFSVTLAGELLAVRYDMSAPLEVLPIEGGSPRRLNESRANDEVLGWSGDGRRVLLKTSLDGEGMYFFAPSDGGPMRQVRLPERPLDRFPPVLSADGRHLLYAVAGDEREMNVLKVLDLGDGRAQEITRHHAPDGSELSGRGSARNRDGDDFLYIEHRGERFELRASAPSGPSRLLRTFRGELPASIAVCEDRIAYRQPQSDPARQGSGSEKQDSLVLARAGDDEPRALLAVPGRGGFESPTWSTDCRRLAVKVYRTPPGAKLWEALELLVLEIDPSGDVIGEPTVLETPDAYWWGPKWLPSGRGLLVVGDDGNTWRISIEPGARPVAITGDLPDPVWDFRISPDGQFIAYARTILRSSSIWRVQLGDVLAGAER